jgi:hypothetical protein
MTRGEPLVTAGLYPIGDVGSAFRVRNEPGGLDRMARVPGLQVRADIIDVVYGNVAPGGPPATLLIADFHLLGSGGKRRFRRADIELRFADNQQRSKDDPEVLQIAPHGHFTLSKTAAVVESRRGANLNEEAGVNGVVW